MIRTVWIRPKPESSEASELADALKKTFTQKGLCVEDAPSEKTDLILALGGDGTLIATLRDLGERRAKLPVLGVHMSRGRGFLHPLAQPPTKTRDRWIEALVAALIEGRYRERSCWGLEGGIQGQAARWALNDFVVTKGALSRMVDMRIRVDGELMFEHLRGDGLIVSSPTGSTAYAFSAGGPIVHAALKNVLLTPICPHELASRSVVLSGDTRVTIEVFGDKGRSFLTVDGQEGEELPAGTILEFGLSRAPIRLLEPDVEGYPSRRYYEQLRSKLGLGGK